MPSQLVSSTGCCQPCDTDPVVVNVPGPQGNPGTNGTNGANGIDSFTYTTASFLVPAFGSSVVVAVDNTSFLPESVAGQFFVSVQGCGYLQVTSVDGLLVTLQNPLAGVLGIPNAIPTTVIPLGSLMTLAGAIGSTGATGAAGDAPKTASYICRTQDATLTNETALELLAAGYMKTLGSTGVGAVTTSAVVPVADIFGTLPIAKGGTGVIATPTNGQVLIGNGTGFTLAQLTQGTNVTITPGVGTITINANPLAAFNYVTFTRRLTGTNFVVSATTKNPFSLADFPSGSWAGIDTASGFTAATGRFTAPYTGYYKIDALFNLLGDTGAAQAIVFLRKNGITNIFQSLQFNVPSSTSQSLVPVSLSYIDQATVITDYYEILIQTTGNALNVSAGSSLSIQRIQA
jgi:hypothetical protein